MAVMMKNKDFNKPNKPESVRIDDRGRISLPKAIRKQMGVEAGDTLFMQWVEGRLEVRKAINPFDVLALHAIEEHKAGRTRSLRGFAADLDVDLDGQE